MNIIKSLKSVRKLGKNNFFVQNQKLLQNQKFLNLAGKQKHQFSNQFTSFQNDYSSQNYSFRENEIKNLENLIYSNKIDSEYEAYKKSQLNKDYSHIKVEYLQVAQKSLSNLKKLDQEILDKLCNEFYENFYPIETSEERCLPIFYQVLKEEYEKKNQGIKNKNSNQNQNKQQQYQQTISFQFEYKDISKNQADSQQNYNKKRENFGDSLESETDVEFSLKEQANNLFTDFKIAFEIVDKSFSGFLLGDITPKFLKGMDSSINKALELIENSKQSEIQLDYSFNQIIQQMYSEIRKYASMDLFKLPEKGIKYPEYESKRNLYERQLLLEEESHELALDKFSKVFEDMQNMNKTQSFEQYRKYIKQWLPNLCKIISIEQQACKFGSNQGDRRYYGQYITQISAEKLTTICLLEFLNQILNLAQRWKKESSDANQYRSSLVSKTLFDKIGKMINIELICAQYEKNLKQKEKEEVQMLIKKINQKYEEQAQEEKRNQQMNGEQSFADQVNKNQISTKTTAEDEIQRMTGYMSLKTKMEKEKFNEQIQKMRFDYKKFEDLGFPKEAQIKLAAFLVHLMKETIKIQNQDGFFIPLIVPSYKKVASSSPNNHQFVGILNINEQFLQQLLDQGDKSDAPFLHLERSLPMIFKPAKWKDSEVGGYYKRPTNLMRLPEVRTQENMQALKYTKLKQLYEILDIVGSTQWRINKKVLYLMEELWEEGGGVARIPKKNIDTKNFVYEFQLKETRSQAERKRLERKIQDQKDDHSLRCDFNLKLNQAQAFKNVSKIYFPHNIDFRGRIYPIPPHLNHMGDDRCRGLLEFAEGKRLGKNGLWWLKVHVSNLWGNDKASFDERYQWIEENLDYILKIGRDPLKHRDWLDKEDSWQAISAIMDLTEAIDSGDPENFISHMHVHQDGSCNGLQHYAALGRDIEGGRQVNLINSERPGDLYTHVAKMVQKKVEQHAMQPDHKFHEIAIKLSGNIARKTIKQTVMTSVYGVTFIGARQQIFKQLKDKSFLNHDDNESYLASHYLASQTLEAIKDLFQSATYIKQWLIRCAQLISTTQNPVSWVTPLGLPVIQPYRKASSFEVIKTQTQTISITKNPDDLPVNKTKQQSAFPPNFIHSLDSSHLMYTARECTKEGIVFASVHDSYWTHAADVERMNVILREQFVKLYSEPLLENLLKSFQKRYPDIDFPKIPERGKLDLEMVKGSSYFFN
ncbi:hypothetical protein PPERSA_08596 [Pseudocohnilembus persalinus]|uniref:DNA-directed RNA polymerase n=1 Tax=Pseudocohnilembus persalinus TaxID=266149 RepID=A0A0V0R1Z1_PSEPJ|nr:hypothetical protein PPERSA_08596 [Pseudocohnilembus persalinus]|eukprot:KRX08397.1 hypothetical protein PPERSA_08596 [Pseudocohnilembus persalinus]